jgi:hypothetical protein
MKPVHAGFSVGRFLALNAMLRKKAAQESPHEARIVDNQRAHSYLLAELAWNGS